MYSDNVILMAEVLVYLICPLIAILFTYSFVKQPEKSPIKETRAKELVGTDPLTNPALQSLSYWERQAMHDRWIKGQL